MICSMTWASSSMPIRPAFGPSRRAPRSATPKNIENTTICRISLLAIASTIELRDQVGDEILQR